MANPPATGAMAAVSFIPLTLVWEYQDIILENINLRKDSNIVQVCTLCIILLQYINYHRYIFDMYTRM